jgi:ABC-2 type transport system ATP-binding protein
MISVQNISKSFGSTRAIQNVSFEIKRGEIVGFLGPNGAGKTTIMRLVTGFFPPTEGQILIDGKNLFQSGSNYRSKIGYLPENNPLYRDMTTRAFLIYVSRLKSISFWKRKEAMAKVTDQCGISSVWKRTIGKLSKGFQQRIGLAQALLGEPDLLVLDEPTNGLDPKQIIEIRSLIQALGQERTIILSTHILPEVKMTCERILILNQGRLVASGTAGELEKDIRHSEELLVKVRGNSVLGKHLFQDMTGVLDVRLNIEANDGREYRILCRQGQDVRSQVARKIVESGFELLSLKSAEVSLEEIFLQIVTQESGDPAKC